MAKDSAVGRELSSWYLNLGITPMSYYRNIESLFAEPDE
ncbi:hypothetical protein NIES25_26420 [Nostoc linckia NIES-25]|nr:hypothetical protein NIES25_26420 [Nostoc linckia NIES-25]